MPAASQLGAILEAARAAVAGLSLTPPVSVVVVSRLPYAREGRDELPMFLVAPLRPEQVTPWASENEVLVKYRVVIALVAAGDHTLGADGLDSFLGWREKARKPFQFGCPGVSSVMLVELRDGDPIDVQMVAEGYDYSALPMTFWNIEPRQ